MNKTVYTRLFLKELGKTYSDNAVAEYLPLWWYNTRDKDEGGLRLTDAGFEIVQEVGITTYNIPYPKDMPMTAQIIIFLDKFIDCPYYITKHGITVTSERKAVELGLFSGDLRKYGLSKALSRAKKVDN